MRASETRFRSLFEQSPFATQIASPDGRTIAVNQAYVELWGVTAEQLRSANFNLLEDQRLAAAGLLPYIRKGFTGEATTIPPVCFTPAVVPSIRGGRARWIRSFIYPTKDGDGAIREVMIMFEDVTEQKQAEEQLRETEEQYRSIFEATSDGLIINDLEGFVVAANPAACRMHGYACEEFVGLHPTQFIRPDYHQHFGEFIQTVRAGGQFQTEAIDLRKDGTPFHVDVRGTRFTYMGKPHILALIRDISEQVQVYQLLEQRVEERTRELSTLLEVSHNVASTLELKPLLRLILDQLKVMVDYSGATIFTLQDRDLTILDHQGPIPQAELARLRFPLERSGANQEVIRRRQPVIIPDVHGDTPLARAFRESASEELYTTFGYIRSWMGVPLMIKERVMGMLSLDHSQPDYFTSRHADLGLAIANQAAIAIENATLYEQAQELAILMERQRLARELHDSVSQALYGIALGARTARTLLDRDPSRLAEPLDYVLSLAEAALAEMRALIFNLRPEALETEGLAAALSKQAASLRARHRIEVQTDLCDEPDLPFEIKEALYRIAQEALHNTAKHARASRVDLRLQCAAKEVMLEVRDNGAGFDPSRSFPGHLGLRSMRERAARAGGTLEIESAPRHGTSLRVRVPARRSR